MDWDASTISLTFLLQIAVTAVVLGALALSTSLAEQRTDHASDCWMLLLASFVTKNHPTCNDLPSLLQLPKETIEGHSDLKYFAAAFPNLTNGGTLPPLHRAAGTNLGEQVLKIIFFPLLGPIFVAMFSAERRARVWTIRHTVYRQFEFSQVIILISMCALVSVATFELILRRYQSIGELVLAVIAISALSSAAVAALIIRNHSDWKNFWTDRVMEIMAVADYQSNHDLFNRAMLIANHLQRQPSIPLPGGFALYTAVFSAVQIGIGLISRSLDLP
jgi:hypothetical protein